MSTPVYQQAQVSSDPNADAVPMTDSHPPNPAQPTVVIATPTTRDSDVCFLHRRDYFAHFYSMLLLFLVVCLCSDS
jgi:hypothetical protein